jgi:hypothetical protein
MIRILGGAGAEDPVPRDPATLPFQAAQAGTTYFGGAVWAADSMRWEAIRDSVWTFDTGVGSSIVGSSSYPYVNPFKLPGLHATMEGWVGIDNSYSVLPYFRRLTAADPRWGSPCVGAPAGLGGDYSFWCGLFPERPPALLRQRPRLRQSLEPLHRASVQLCRRQHHVGVQVHP